MVRTPSSSGKGPARPPVPGFRPGREPAARVAPAVEAPADESDDELDRDPFADPLDDDDALPAEAEGPAEEDDEPPALRAAFDIDDPSGDEPAEAIDASSVFGTPAASEDDQDFDPPPALRAPAIEAPAARREGELAAFNALSGRIENLEGLIGHLPDRAELQRQIEGHVGTLKSHRNRTSLAVAAIVLVGLLLFVWYGSGWNDAYDNYVAALEQRIEIARSDGNDLIEQVRQRATSEVATAVADVQAEAESAMQVVFDNAATNGVNSAISTEVGKQLDEKYKQPIDQDFATLRQSLDQATARVTALEGKPASQSGLNEAAVLALIGQELKKQPSVVPPLVSPPVVATTPAPTPPPAPGPAAATPSPEPAAPAPPPAAPATLTGITATTTSFDLTVNGTKNLLELITGTFDGTARPITGNELVFEAKGAASVDASGVLTGSRKGQAVIKVGLKGQALTVTIRVRVS